MIKIKLQGKRWNPPTTKKVKGEQAYACGKGRREIAIATRHAMRHDNRNSTCHEDPQKDGA
jgi:hypothetical protein